MTMLDPRDTALQAACMLIAAPRFGPLPAMPSGQRMVLAANGLFLQVRLSWLKCLLRVGVTHPQLSVPYGTLEEAVQFRFGPLPAGPINAFVRAGRQCLPNELAGGLVYCAGTRSLRLQLFETRFANAERVDYRLPTLAADEVLAVDLHTHGTAPAFFSSDDDRDDNGVKIAGVFGNLDQSHPSARFRLVIGGLHVPLPNPWEPLAGSCGGLYVGAP
ncbi:PRTRC system protein A [Janthinobacterium sp. PSPC3-1]|uniref:PRTRC system protein A n=1 Tax=Janthinobacterium sp. PSPC3-1 TaxID=2804653 RepID=UPI003CF44B4E